MAARILIVEDYPDTLELMRCLLAASGHQVSAASRGEGAVEAAWRERPDLILCDIQLPGIDGYEVARRLRADPGLAHIPVVAVTALAMAGDRDKALAHFDGYLSKPIDPDAFVAQVEALLPPRMRNAPYAWATATAPESATLVASRPTILAVDNVQVNLDLAIGIFEPFGYRVVIATDPRKAMHLARESPPDLILSDVCMAPDTGYAFLHAVKADPRLRRIPFIFLTATATNEADLQRGLASGAAKYLLRPIEPAALLGEIAAFLPKRQLA